MKNKSLFLMMVAFVGIFAKDDGFTDFVKREAGIWENENEEGASCAKKKKLEKSITVDIELLGNKLPEKENPLKLFVLFYWGRRVMVVHGTGSEACLKNIMEKGLCSRRKMLREASVEHLRAFYQESDQSDECLRNKAQADLNYVEILIRSQVFDGQQIFFAPGGSCLSRFGNVGMLVDPDKTYVYNTLYKIDVDRQRESFIQSRVLLSTYLKHLQNAERMRKERSDCEVYLDPQSAEPRYKKSEEQVEKYIAEIPYNTEEISEQRLILIQNFDFGIRSVLLGEKSSISPKDFVC